VYDEVTFVDRRAVRVGVTVECGAAGGKGCG
jgi:hypothetical protein